MKHCASTLSRGRAALFAAVLCATALAPAAAEAATVSRSGSTLRFTAATWKRWGMDADGDGKASPYNSVDAIFSSARYLLAKQSRW